MWTESILLRAGTGGRPCEHGNQPPGSTNGKKFLYLLSGYLFTSKEGPCSMVLYPRIQGNI
jgi:hypothetical protein